MTQLNIINFHSAILFSFEFFVICFFIFSFAIVFLGIFDLNEYRFSLLNVFASLISELNVTSEIVFGLCNCIAFAGSALFIYNYRNVNLKTHKSQNFYENDVLNHEDPNLHFFTDNTINNTMSVEE